MITKEEIIKDYNLYIKMAQTACEKCRYESALNNIRYAARLGYHMNYKFSDPCAEEILAEVAKKALPKYDFIPIKSRYVFYDGVAQDSLVLTKHYMRALHEWGVKFLYITEDRDDKSGWFDIMAELNTYKNAELYRIPVYNSNADKMRAAAEKIAQFKPERAFLQLYAYDSSGAALWNAFPQVERYQINTTDHAYWIGLNCADYIIEFRNYGWNLSQQYRGVDEKRQLVQPYYAAETKTAYRGLPGDPSKIKLFSGGAEYKIHGDGNKFLDIINHILTTNPNAQFYFAGDGFYSEMREYIEQHGFENRWFILGHRSDIFEVMRHIDIYLGTYPVSGGLMTLIAAECAKPIVAYCRRNGSNLKELFSTTREIPQISFKDLDEFYCRVNELCANTVLCKAVGQKLKLACLTEKDFNSSLKTLISTKKNVEQLVKYSIGSDEIARQYLDIENSWWHIYPMLNLNLQYMIKRPGKCLRYAIEVLHTRGLKTCFHKLCQRCFKHGFGKKEKE